MSSLQPYIALLSQGNGNAPSALIHKALDLFHPMSCRASLHLCGLHPFHRSSSASQLPLLQLLAWVLRICTCLGQMGEKAFLGRELAPLKADLHVPLIFIVSTVCVNFQTSAIRVKGKSELFFIPHGIPLQVLRFVQLFPLIPDDFRS